MHKKCSAIIFDGDDTLWETQVFYDEAKERFYDLMGKQGFDRSTVKTKLAEIDVANVHEFGFSKSRFPLSMRQTYEYFCDKNSQVADSTIRNKAGEIGYSVFRRKHKIMNGARDILGQLREIYRLYLYSGGDTEIQRRKLEDLGLAACFDKVYIEERKSEVELRRILEEQKLDSERTWLVGNSLRSDINPALRVGLRCIWVRSDYWEFDNDVRLSGQVWQIGNLNEIPDILAQVDGARQIESHILPA